MKIEIDIDIESIVKEALKKQQQHPEEIISIPVETSNSRSRWEYGRKNGKRRTPEEMALHDAERKCDRRLTPEEKGEIRAKFQLDDTAENQAKEALLRKDRIEKLAASALASASKEVAEENKPTETESSADADSLFTS